MVRIALAVPTADHSQPAEDRAAEWVAAGTPEPLRSQLIDLLGPERILTRALDLVGYASDASPYRKIPKAVVMAHDTADIVKLFQFARRNGARTRTHPHTICEPTKCMKKEPRKSEALFVLRF